MPWSLIVGSVAVYWNKNSHVPQFCLKSSQSSFYLKFDTIQIAWKFGMLLKEKNVSKTFKNISPLVVASCNSVAVNFKHCRLLCRSTTSWPTVYFLLYLLPCHLLRVLSPTASPSPSWSSRFWSTNLPSTRTSGSSNTSMPLSKNYTSRSIRWSFVISVSNYCCSQQVWMSMQFSCFLLIRASNHKTY